MILVDKELQTFLLNGDTDAPGKTAIFGGDESIELARAAATVSAFLNFNLAVLGGISFLSLFLSELVGREKRWSRALWLIPTVCFAAILILNLLA